jgi:hypothetical protein
MATTETEAAALQAVRARLAAGNYPSPDAYYQDKDLARELAAKAAGMTPDKYDPVGFWFGMQSN